jgi:hypothetical protein
MSITRQERERAVLDLYYNQRKSVREIAKEARMSFRDIGAILNKASEDNKETEQRKEQQQEGAEKNQMQLSVSTQAYKLFSEGKAPIEVAVALNTKASYRFCCSPLTTVGLVKVELHICYLTLEAALVVALVTVVAFSMCFIILG